MESGLTININKVIQLFFAYKSESAITLFSHDKIAVNNKINKNRQDQI